MVVTTLWVLAVEPGLLQEQQMLLTMEPPGPPAVRLFPPPFFLGGDRVSLCSPGCPGTHYLEQATFKLTEACLPLPPERPANTLILFMCMCSYVCV